MSSVVCAHWDLFCWAPTGQAAGITAMVRRAQPTAVAHYKGGLRALSASRVSKSGRPPAFAGEADAGVFASKHRAVAQKAGSEARGPVHRANAWSTKSSRPPGDPDGREEFNSSSLRIRRPGRGRTSRPVRYPALAKDWLPNAKREEEGLLLLRFFGGFLRSSFRRLFLFGSGHSKSP